MRDDSADSTAARAGVSTPSVVAATATHLDELSWFADRIGLPKRD
jgi:hypothetical protein